MPNKIPLDDTRKARRDRQRKLLEADEADEQRALDHLALRASLVAAAARNGDELSQARLWAIVDEMEQRGMQPGTIQRGPNAYNQLAALHSRPDAMAAALGHLLEAIDVLAAAGYDADARALQKVFDKHDQQEDPAAINAWRAATRPVKEVPLRLF